MNKVILFCILSVLVLGNELFAQNPANASISFFNSLIKESNGIDIKKCFIKVLKNGHNEGIVSANGKWIIKHEISSDSVDIYNYTDFTGKLLLHDRGVENSENEYLTYKLFDLDGKLLFDETCYDEDGKYKAKGRRFKAILKYLLKSDKDIQTDLLTDKDFGYARFDSDLYNDGAIKALEDGYLMFETAGYAKLKGTFAINKDGKILKDVSNYCGNHIFYVRNDESDSGYCFVRF